VFSICILLSALALFLIAHPQSPLPPQWNPLKPLSVTDPITPMTSWKLRQALSADSLCRAALGTGAAFQDLPDFEQSAQCHIKPQVRLTSVGDARMRPLYTRCQTALRLAMWHQHSIAPKAQDILNQPVREILHLSSYNCREIRTASGPTGRMSTHATADAVDIQGFVIAEGQRILLQDHWQDGGERGGFLRAVRDGACDWFRLTLGPDYNALHSDHFHLQHTGWGLCR
jgi:hypothetical protein